MIPLRDNIPSRRYPVVTVAIIVANVFAFFYELSLPSPVLKDFLDSYGMVPANLQLYPVPVLTNFGISLVTAMFLHGGFVHLLGNMWYLWIFGDNVEERMGSARFLFFYMLCGILAGLAHIPFNLNSPVPTIGASGAVAGVLGAYLVSYPFARVSTFIPLFFLWTTVELPAILVLGSWFFIQLFNGTASLSAASSMMGGVAWWAHIGGFISGIVLIGAFARPTVRRYYWE